MLEELRLIHSSEEEIRCVFHSLVIRKEALREKYTGGVKAFAERHVARFNNGLGVICAMSAEDLDEALFYIRRNGLISGDDYVYFHALTLPERIIGEMPELGEETDFGTTWLRGYPNDGVMLVYYQEEVG